MDPERLRALRHDYARGGLDESDLLADPLEMFERWLDEADDAGVHEPNAMVLATVADGRPSSRAVLLKEVSAAGFSFYTNLASRKAGELAGDAWCALTFPWFELQRQVRVEGRAERAERAQEEAYFASRPRDSQLGAWASVDPVPQSGEVASRDALQAAYDTAEARFEGGDVPCPPSWGGYVVRPVRMEFWQGRHGRMHDRLVYVRDEPSAAWRTLRLAP